MINDPLQRLLDKDPYLKPYEEIIRRRLTSIHETQKRIEAGDPAPECGCGGYLKPDTVSFGQQLPADKIATAEKWCRECDVLIVIGSTLLVQPAASLPVLAKQNGAFLAIINLTETPCDEYSDVLINDKAGKIFPMILDAIKGNLS